MARVTPSFSALNYGYISPKLRGRADLDFYDQALDYLQNYIVTPQGEASYRPGSIYVAHTRDDNEARLIPFLYNTEQAYVVEVTDQFMRFYKDNGLITDTAQDITGITQADPAVVTYDGADNYANGDRVYLNAIAGMHQLNGREFIVANVDTGANTFEIQDVAAVDIDSTGYDAYVSGGTVAEIIEIASPYLEADLFEFDFTQTNDTMYIVHADHAPRKLTRTSHTAWTIATFSRTSDPFTGADLYPSIVTLFEGRIIYGASNDFPIRLWFSKILTTGVLDDFTTGTADDDAIIFNLRSDQANRLRWIVGAENYMALGTSGSEHRITGGGDNNAITPTNISIKPTSFNGVATTRPIRLDSYILYTQRNGKTVRSFEYNALQDGYTSPDRTLLADHIGASKMKQFTFTAGTPNLIWGVRNDGKLTGLTFDPAQQVVAWHLHKTNGLWGSVATIPDADEDDEMWQVVTRTKPDGTVERFVEYVPNNAAVPVFEDYFTGEDNKDTDETTWLSALWNIQKTLVHADSALIYDGRDSATVGLTITGDLDVGDAVTVTADGAYFDADMATDLRRIQSPDGGQIELDTFTSTTVMTGTVKYAVETATWAAGEWYYMAKGLSGLFHLEGQTVTILADGGVQEGEVVSSGEITLDDDAGYVVVGLAYIGIGKTQDVNGGSEIGTAITKPRAMTKLGVRLRASLGTKFGTDLYNMEHPAYREVGEVAGRPPHLFSGVLDAQMSDGWDEEKNVYWLHDKPTPSNIQYLQPLMETHDG